MLWRLVCTKNKNARMVAACVRRKSGERARLLGVEPQQAPPSLLRASALGGVQRSCGSVRGALAVEND
jgi:hypothetical protein